MQKNPQKRFPLTDTKAVVQQHCLSMHTRGGGLVAGKERGRVWKKVERVWKKVERVGKKGGEGLVAYKL